MSRPHATCVESEAAWTVIPVLITGSQGISIRSVTGAGRLTNSTVLRPGPERRLYDLDAGMLQREFEVPDHTAFVDVSPDGR